MSVCDVMYCGETSKWIRLVFSVTVTADDGYFVLGGDPVPLAERKPRP